MGTMKQEFLRRPFKQFTQPHTENNSQKYPNQTLSTNMRGHITFSFSTILLLSLCLCLLFSHTGDRNKMKRQTTWVAFFSPRTFFYYDFFFIDHQRRKSPLTKNILEQQSAVGPLFSQLLGGKVISPTCVLSYF